jgi:hypothetical protein
MPDVKCQTSESDYNVNRRRMAGSTRIGEIPPVSKVNKSDPSLP